MFYDADYGPYRGHGMDPRTSDVEPDYDDLPGPARVAWLLANETARDLAERVVELEEDLAVARRNLHRARLS